MFAIVVFSRQTGVNDIKQDGDSMVHSFKARPVNKKVKHFRLFHGI